MCAALYTPVLPQLLLNSAHLRAGQRCAIQWRSQVRLAYILNSGEVVALQSKAPAGPGKSLPAGQAWICGARKSKLHHFGRRTNSQDGHTPPLPKRRKWITTSSSSCLHPGWRFSLLSWLFPRKMFSPWLWACVTSPYMWRCAGFPYPARAPNVSLP